MKGLCTRRIKFLAPASLYAVVPPHHFRGEL